jgi:hypothetical protein
MSYTAKELLGFVERESERDLCIKTWILAGYMPSYMHMVPVTTSMPINGQEVSLTIYCYPDYLRFGDDSDSIIANMSHDHATEIAEKMGCMLPTRKMVDLIYQNAATKMSPIPMQWGPQMQSTNYMIQNNSLIESQKRSRGAVDGTLLAGHKKDVVISAQAHRNPGRESIYGWHQANGKVIQPLSFAHDTAYSDYSHGARLILKKANLDWAEVDLSYVLADPDLCKLISDEGPLTPSQ